MIGRATARVCAALLACGLSIAPAPAAAQSDADRAVEKLRDLLGDTSGESSWPTRRSYDPRVLVIGEKLFRRNCAVCHGWSAEGTVENWQQRDADGKYPPPPLNGSAHAWHHPTTVLLRIIKQGTRPLGGSMPPFGEELTDEQIITIIQWITSLWSEEIYAMWEARSGGQ